MCERERERERERGIERWRKEHETGRERGVGGREGSGRWTFSTQSVEKLKEWRVCSTARGGLYRGTGCFSQTTREISKDGRQQRLRSSMSE